MAKDNNDHVTDMGFSKKSPKSAKGGTNAFGFGDEAQTLLRKGGDGGPMLPDSGNEKPKAMDRVGEDAGSTRKGYGSGEQGAGDDGKPSPSDSEAQAEPEKGEKLKENWWDKAKNFAKKHPISSLAIAGATLVGAGGAMAGLSGGAAAGVALPMMVAGVACLAAVPVALAVYGIYKFCKWASGKKKPKENLQGQNTAKSQKPDKGKGQEHQVPKQPAPAMGKPNEFMQKSQASPGKATILTPTPRALKKYTGHKPGNTFV